MKLFCKHKYKDFMDAIVPCDTAGITSYKIKYAVDLKCIHCGNRKMYTTDDLEITEDFNSCRHRFTEYEAQEINILRFALINKVNKKYNLNIKI